ncbi:hypothetical protein Syun_002400 [Stephania yunnanensis]|uniref:Glutaredoxin domain-containing protein n=1 Tax=Stephania yunnanensis TaxID=152371 RepID=A0AAP0Q7E2_9MAGN
MIDVKTMKGVKGSKFLKKLKSIRPIEALKQQGQGQVIHLNASDGWLDCIFEDPVPQSKDPFVITSSAVEEMELNGGGGVNGDVGGGDKENEGPSSSSLKPPKCPSLLVPIKPSSQNLLPSSSSSRPLSELDASSLSLMAPAKSAIDQGSETCGSCCCCCSFRRPDMNSKTLFDPKLLLAFEEAVRDHVRAKEEERRVMAETVNTRESDVEALLGFAEKCPPRGSESVILYTTSLRGIRKTFEDCNTIKFLLGSFKIVFYERDVSMHLEFREELWRVLGGGRVVPPRLFIRGRYIGGADEVVGLHEQGKLLQLFRGIPRHHSTSPCKECGGARFLMCFNCDGSRKLKVNDGGEGELEESRVHCPDCNENGLIVCPFCC